MYYIPEARGLIMDIVVSQEVWTKIIQITVGQIECFEIIPIKLQVDTIYSLINYWICFYNSTLLFFYLHLFCLDPLY